MELAKSLNAGDEYIELSRTNPEVQFQKLKAENPYGFDIVVEATGSPKILEDAINYVRRGGKLVVYGVYSSAAKVSWSPSKIFGDEITILGSFSETYMFRMFAPFFIFIFIFYMLPCFVQMVNVFNSAGNRLP